MNVILEQAGIHDSPAILRLQVLTYQSEAKIYNSFEIPPLTQSLTEIHQESRTHTFLVARQLGEIIGSVRAICRDRRCYVERLIVHPSYQLLPLRTCVIVRPRFDRLVQSWLVTDLHRYNFWDAPGISQRVCDILSGQFAHDQCKAAFERCLDGASINPLHVFGGASATHYFH